MKLTIPLCWHTKKKIRLGGVDKACSNLVTIPSWSD